LCRNRVLAYKRDSIEIRALGISNILHLWKFTVNGLGPCPSISVVYYLDGCVKSPNYCDRFFLFLFLFFLNHMFIVSTVQEMTCIFNDMAKQD